MLNTILSLVYIFLFSDYSSCILDLVFVVDASDKVTDDWNTHLDFVTHFAKRVNIGPQGTHIALVRNGKHAKTVFNFKEFRKTPSKEQTILEKITSMPGPQAGERSYVYKGLIKTVEVFNKTRFGMKSNGKKVYSILFELVNYAIPGILIYLEKIKAETRTYLVR